MKRFGCLLVALGFASLPAWTYVEVPYSLGRCLQESTTVVLMEVDKVNKDKGMIIFKKLGDIKGKHPDPVIKHNIGKRGFHPREWQIVMAWAEPGKKAVFFHNGGASETCIGSYWYQCYREGEWWGMSHAEPYLLRTFCGDPEKLADGIKAMLQGQQIVVPCMVDGPKDQLQQRKGKLHLLKASLKLQDYNPRRDFVGFGGDAVDIPQFKTVLLLNESSPGWKYTPAEQLRGDDWQKESFNDAAWQRGKAPLGYGELEIAKRSGTTITIKGKPFLFRRDFEMPSELLQKKGVVFRLGVASDDNALLYLNGKLADRDPEADHEFAYWNREIELTAAHFKPGKNVLAVRVNNKASSSDIYFDMEISALIPLPKKTPTPVVVAKAGPEKIPELPPEKLPAELVIDKKGRTVTLPCVIAPRKLPHLKDVYPIEVLATYPHPEGQKAHETVVNFKGIKPSMVHQALTELGLKPGRPARGEGVRPSGPEVAIFLEMVDGGGKTQRWPLEQVLIDTRTGKQPPPLGWHFTGSAFRQPNPEKNEFVYGANLTGTLASFFPVTDECVLQAATTLDAEKSMRLEINRKLLPKDGTPALLILRTR